jgi:hypothetical protein
MNSAHNGVASTALQGVTWVKSRRSNSQGNCVELARLDSDSIAVRNSRFPSGPALVYTQAEIDALILGAKDGDFDGFLS